METKATEREKVGLLLASGYTKKEVANKLGKSVNTVTKQTSRLYEKTGSHNLADLTRHMIKRYSGINTEDLLIRAMHDITIVAAIVLLTIFAKETGVLEMLKASLIELFNHK